MLAEAANRAVGRLDFARADLLLAKADLQHLDEGQAEVQVRGVAQPQVDAEKRSDGDLCVHNQACVVSSVSSGQILLADRIQWWLCSVSHWRPTTECGMPRSRTSKKVGRRHISGIQVRPPFWGSKVLRFGNTRNTHDGCHVQVQRHAFCRCHPARTHLIPSHVYLLVLLSRMIGAEGIKGCSGMQSGSGRPIMYACTASACAESARTGTPL